MVHILAVSGPITQRQIPVQTIPTTQENIYYEDYELPFYYVIGIKIMEKIMGNNATNNITVTREINNNNTITTSTVNTEQPTIPTYKCCPGLYIELIIIAIIVILGIIFFVKSVKSRKYYKCPNCGESFRSENMTSMTCKVCGSTLEETDDTTISDKTK